MNCNSSYNGCASCAPPIYTFYKSNSVPIWTFGEDPFIPPVGGELVKYLQGNNKDSYTTRKQLVYGQCAAPPPNPIPPDWPGYPPGYTCQGELVGTRTDVKTQNGTATWIWDYKIDSCGNLYADYSENAFGIETKNMSPTITVGCFAPSNTPCCRDAEGDCICSSSSTLTYVKNLWEDGEYSYGGNCGNGYDPQGGINIISETEAITKVESESSSSNDINTTNYTEFSKGEGKTILANKKDLAFFQKITHEAVSKSINNENSLNNPCISYSPWFFTPTETSWNTGDKDIAINALKILIAVKKDDFKEYFSINGKYYLYYGGGVGETPCCQECGGPECFTGTIVKTENFSLARTSNIELADYFVGSFLRIDNYLDALPLNQSLKFCYTIENLT